MTDEKQKPVRTLRDGLTKAVIWKNESEKGAFYSVEFIRSYTDGEDNWHDTSSFSGSQILKVANIAGQAYNVIGQLKAEDARIAQEEA